VWWQESIKEVVGGPDYATIIPRRPNYKPERADESLAVSVDADDHVAALVRLGLGGEHVGQADYGECGPMPTERLDQRRGRSPAVLAGRDRLPSRVAFPQGGY
jgi:hypothetical protein